MKGTDAIPKTRSRSNGTDDGVGGNDVYDGSKPLPSEGLLQEGTSYNRKIAESPLWGLFSLINNFQKLLTVIFQFALTNPVNH